MHSSGLSLKCGIDGDVGFSVDGTATAKDCLCQISDAVCVLSRLALILTLDRARRLTFW